MVVPLPDISKSPTQLLIEARDARHRDVREIVADLYNEHRRLESVAAELTRLIGRTISPGTVHQWATSDWGWRLERVLVIPAEAGEREEVAA